MTRLVTVAHGTRHATGNAVAAEVTRAAGQRLGGEAVTSYVELCTPLFASVMDATVEPTVVVPLLLSTGYHVRHDLPDAVSAASADVRMAGPLGPDLLLARVMVQRLVEAGATPGQPVVMVAAGSHDPLASDDLADAVVLLAAAWGGPVRLATLAGLGPRPEQVVRRGDVVATYLLAEGHFSTRARETCLALGATAVADPIGPHPLLVDLVVARVNALLAPAGV